MASMLEVAIITILLIGIFLAGATYYLSIRRRNFYASIPNTKGMNGVAGQTIQLSCPEGQVIDFHNYTQGKSYRGALIATGDSNCDAFYQQSGQENIFNPDTTIDVFASNSPFLDLKDCSGKQTCSWKIPTSKDLGQLHPSVVPECMTSSTNIQFIGTYDCISGGK